MAEKEVYFVESRIRGYSHRKYRTVLKAAPREKSAIKRAVNHLKQAGEGNPLDILLLACLLGIIAYLLNGYLPPVLPVKVLWNF